MRILVAWLAAAGLAVTGATALFAADVAPQRAAIDAAPDAEQVAKGKALYSQRCLHCHGINMVATGTVSYDLRQFPKDDHRRFIESVVNGRNNRMPPWGDVLTLEEIDELWAYVRTGGKP